MSQFEDKAIFIWNDFEIGSAAKITQMLIAANFEGAYLHSTHTSNWRTTSRTALAKALKAAGFAVYASCAVYGYASNPASSEGHQAAAIVNEFGLDGAIFDVESGAYEQTGADARVRSLFCAYQEMTGKPSAFCGWPFYHAPNNFTYFSSTSSKLTYKDSAGTSHALY